MADAARVVARSYRSVFALERRIYRIDRLRLTPTGVPVLGVVYAVAVLAVVVALSSLPGIGALLGLLPWPVRLAALPGSLGALGCLARIDGRAPHRAVWSLLRFACASRRLWRLGAARSPDTWRPPPLLLIPDGSEARLGSLRYRGPGAVQVSVAHRRSTRGRTVRVQGGGGKGAGQVVVLRPGARLRTRPQE